MQTPNTSTRQQRKGKKRQKTQKVNNDLWVFYEENTTNVPDIVLQDYYQFYDNAIFLDEITTSLPTANTETLATTSTYAPLATDTSKLAIVVGGTLALGGIALVATRGNSQKNTDAPFKLPPPKPIAPPIPKPNLETNIKINEINVVNQASAAGNIIISGTLHVSDTTAKTSIDLMLGNQKITPTSPIDIVGQTWQTTIQGSILANYQNQTLTAILTANNNNNNTQSKTVSTNKHYVVDVIPPTDTLILDEVLGDNILNKADLDQPTHTISGRLLIDDSKLQAIAIIVNGNSYPAAITNDRYQAPINTNDLAADNAVIVHATLIDKAGNTTLLSQTQHYTIDDIPPKIQSRYFEPDR